MISLSIVRPILLHQRNIARLPHEDHLPRRGAKSHGVVLSPLRKRPAVPRGLRDAPGARVRRAQPQALRLQPQGDRLRLFDPRPHRPHGARPAPGPGGLQGQDHHDGRHGRAVEGHAGRLGPHPGDGRPVDDEEGPARRERKGRRAPLHASRTPSPPSPSSRRNSTGRPMPWTA